MEVTRKNFKEILPLVTDSIEKADFLVIDGEFTGVRNGRDVSIFDTPQEYYTTLFNGSTEFLLVQYGLSAFYWNDKEQYYMNDTYNFYLFPRGKPGSDKTFLCQTSSLDFLAAQGFDFNKAIRDGISFMTEPTETRLREQLTERQKSYTSEKDFVTIPEENKQQIEDICNQVRHFLDEGKSDEMEIERCNAFVRRLLFQELGSRFKKEAFVETKILENKNRVLNVSRLTSSNECEDRSSQKRDKEWEELEDAVGFSKVARLISQSGKLVIGHNMILDLMHTLNQFFHPLPSDYKGFKEFAHCMFPRLLDTKYMSSLPPFKDKVNSSVLQHLLGTLSEPPFSLPRAESEEGRGYSCAEDKHHEAGYDAYVTGLCFLSMHGHLSRMRGEPSGRVMPSDAAMLKPFVNKLYLAKTAHQDSPYINLVGDEPAPSRDHVFHLTFPKEWQRNDISQLFSPFGTINVQFLDDTSALVALSRRDRAREVVRALSGHKRIVLQPYARYRNKTLLKEAEFKRDLAIAHTPDTIARQRYGNVPKVASPRPQKTQTPEKVERTRSNSVSAPANHSDRKRRSSGVNQADEAEPPPKKGETDIDSPKKKPELEIEQKKRDKPDAEQKKTPNKLAGKRKNEDSEKKDTNERQLEKDEHQLDKEILIQEFDSATTAKCVSAFKESDSWD